MSVVVVGLSYRTAPVAVLERAAVAAADVGKTLDELQRAESISEVLLLSTCNRVEVYADASRFHPAVADVTSVLARHSGLSVAELSEHLYVHFAEAAVEHMLAVAAGLDSMVVGESQILGQLRQSYALGRETGSVGTVLHDLAQTALRVGKRVHADTGIDRAGASVVSVALDHAARLLGGLDGRSAVVVGAGSMGALSAATLRRRGCAELAVVNRSIGSAQRVATAHAASAAPLEQLPALIAQADLVISCTGATGQIVDSDMIEPRSGRQLVVLDLALPRDVAPAVGEQAGVSYVDLDALRSSGVMVSDDEVAAASAIVAEELGEYLSEQQRLAVAPTVTALRAKANQVIDAELVRLDGRLPGLAPDVRREVADAVRRAVEKVVHAPTVRVKELASVPGGDRYASALRELFDLDPATVQSVAAVKQTPGESS
jgi:glutamyl-tRNA reductase